MRSSMPALVPVLNFETMFESASVHFVISRCIKPLLPVLILSREIIPRVYPCNYLMLIIVLCPCYLFFPLRTLFPLSVYTHIICPLDTLRRICPSLFYPRASPEHLFLLFTRYHSVCAPFLPALWVYIPVAPFPSFSYLIFLGQPCTDVT